MTSDQLFGLIGVLLAVIGSIVLGSVAMGIYFRAQRKKSVVLEPVPVYEVKTIDHAAMKILDEIKVDLEIYTIPDEPVYLKYLKTTNLYEMGIFLRIENQSAHEFKIIRISWEFWLAGSHIKAGVRDSVIEMAPHSKIEKLDFKEVFFKNQIDGVIKPDEDARGYLEGIVFVECQYGKFEKHFCFLNLNFKMQPGA